MGYIKGYAECFLILFMGMLKTLSSAELQELTFRADVLNRVAAYRCRHILIAEQQSL
jgi:hypothetical protein